MEFRALAETETSFNFLLIGKEDCDISNEKMLREYFNQHHVDFCINCAAYTAVDKAETEEKQASEINDKAAASLASICKDHQSIFFHISTDYVFDGNANTPYKEADTTNPLGMYGSSKLTGEKSVMQSNPESVIVRTSWVYSRYGKNFVKTMLRLLAEKESINVVNDQYGSPTYAADLAAVILQIIKSGKHQPGIYHYCNEGIITWYEFAQEIKNIKKLTCSISPITTAEYPTPARRPQYSALDTEKIRTTFSLTIPHWKESLQECLKAI